MVYKRYIVRNGKRYGPYYYHNRRIGGRVVTQYVASPPLSQKRSFNVLSSLVFVLCIFVLVTVLSLFILTSELSGRATLDVTTTSTLGAPLEGALTLTLQPGELIPADTEVIVSSGTEEKTFLLESVASAPLTSGTFYAEGTALSGMGAGVGGRGKPPGFSPLSTFFV